MPQHWRCTNGHAWTGDLGALTFCPECGSADVYEYRPASAAPERTGPAKPAGNRGDQLQASASSSDQTLVQAPGWADSDQTFVQSPGTSDQTLVQSPVGSDQTLVQPRGSSDQTLVQSSHSSDQTFIQAPFASDQTLVQPSVPAAHRTRHAPAASDQTLIQPRSADESTGDWTSADVSGGDRSSGARGPDSDTTFIQPGPPGTTTTLIQPIPASALDTTLHMVVPMTPSADSQTVTFAQIGGPSSSTADFTPPSHEQTVLMDESADGSHRTTPSDVTFQFVDTSAPDATGDFSAASASDETASFAPPGDPGRASSAPSSPVAPDATYREASGSRHERPTVAANRKPPSGSDRPPQPKAAPLVGLPVVEGYEVLGVLGRGGMGVVYKARQQGLNRLVALKMIIAGAHAGAADKNRFRQEAEAVAALQHPNIVQVYETGLRDGLPFFSLEYLDGGSLQDKVDGQPVPPRLAAECVERLALAMQYAHDHGIVHRDLKPANILLLKSEARSSSSGAQRTTGTLGASITIGDTAYVPKITDFGLAKRVEQDSGLTGTGAILGTPSYMSPEQALGNTNAVGPSADIYALGTILYELLTGRPPFLGTDAMDTIVKVRSVDPVPPTRLQPKTPRDLETICLKCLQKEPSRRYPTAGDLAADVRRFLDGQPIVARPVPLWEKGYKWTLRHPAGAGLIALSSLVTLGLAAGGFAWARLERARADIESERADREAKLHEIAQQQRDRAEVNFKAAREAVDQLLTRVGDEKLKNIPLLETLRLDLLSQALRFYDRFLTAEGNDPGVRLEAGWAYQRAGRAREMLGQRAEAIEAYRKAQSLFGDLISQFGDQVEYRAELAQTHRLLAIVLEADRRPTEAEKEFESARQTLAGLAQSMPSKHGFRQQLGELYSLRSIQLKERDRLEDSAEYLRKAASEFQAVSEAEPSRLSARLEWARAESNLSTILMGLGRSDAAAEQARAAVARLTALIADHQNVAEYAKELGRAYANLGGILARSGKPEAARAVYGEAVTTLEAMSRKFPRSHEYRFMLALALNNLALLNKETQGLRAAEPDREKARALLADLSRDHPSNADYSLQYALSLDEFAIFLAASDRLAEATKEETTAVDTLRRLVRTNPLDAELSLHLARRLLNLGQLQSRARNFDAAETSYDDSARLLTDLRQPANGSSAILEDLALVHMNRALLSKSVGKPKDEEARWQQVASLQQALTQRFPNSAQAHAALAQTRVAIAVLQAEEPSKAILSLREAVHAQRVASRLVPRGSEYSQTLGVYASALSEALLNTADHAGVATVATDLGHDAPDSWRGWPRVAGYLARCTRVVREDTKLTPDQREKLARAYGAQAIEILKRAIGAGYSDIASLRTSADLEPLRTGDFASEFEKLVGKPPVP